MLLIAAIFVPERGIETIAWGKIVPEQNASFASVVLRLLTGAFSHCPCGVGAYAYLPTFDT